MQTLRKSCSTELPEPNMPEPQRPSEKYSSFAPGAVHLEPGLFHKRFEVNLAYLKSLKTGNLLQNHFFEAGIDIFRDKTPEPQDDPHWGWETPTCLVRGHFLGHWLSAASRVYASTRDTELKVKLDRVVTELGTCQERNGGEWVFSIPEKYMDWTASGVRVAVPHYVVHKTLMGLFDAYRYASSAEALTVLENASRWFHAWTRRFSRDQMDDILDIETGGMLEVWANLYGATGAKHVEDLLERYTRARLFDPLLESKDVLTNMHANTTIPEIHGAARAYEVTGDGRWRSIVERYWECAVASRGTFCTGGQTSGEVWTPPYEFAARRGSATQEHCTVYNMIRLADYLFRWSGDGAYADYIERNLYNGILAQQHPHTGMVSYFLPLEAGGRKKWGTPTHDFWCCHGTLVQAHTAHNAYIYYGREKEVVVSQYIPSRLTTTVDGKQVTLAMEFDTEAEVSHRPERWAIDIAVTCDGPTEMDLKLRVPDWVRDHPTVLLNGERQTVEQPSPRFYSLSRTWHTDSVRVELPKRLTSSAIPDEPGTVAFMDGPVVLAGLCETEHTLRGDKDEPGAMLLPDNERKHGRWLTGYRTTGQERGIKFKPLHEIIDEPYTVYFPVKP